MHNNSQSILTANPQCRCNTCSTALSNATGPTCPGCSGPATAAATTATMNVIPVRWAPLWRHAARTAADTMALLEGTPLANPATLGCVTRMIAEHPNPGAGVRDIFTLGNVNRWAATEPPCYTVADASRMYIGTRRTPDADLLRMVSGMVILGSPPGTRQRDGARAAAALDVAVAAMSNVRQPGMTGVRSFSSCIEITSVAFCSADRVAARELFDGKIAADFADLRDPRPMRNIVTGIQRHRYNQPYCGCLLCDDWILGA